MDLSLNIGVVYLSDNIGTHLKVIKIDSKPKLTTNSYKYNE